MFFHRFRGLRLLVIAHFSDSRQKNLQGSVSAPHQSSAKNSLLWKWLRYLCSQKKLALLHISLIVMMGVISGLVTFMSVCVSCVRIFSLPACVCVWKRERPRVCISKDCGSKVRQKIPRLFLHVMCFPVSLRTESILSVLPVRPSRPIIRNRSPLRLCSFIFLSHFTVRQQSCFWFIWLIIFGWYAPLCPLLSFAVRLTHTYTFTHPSAQPSTHSRTQPTNRTIHPPTHERSRQNSPHATNTHTHDPNSRTYTHRTDPSTLIIDHTQKTHTPTPTHPHLPTNEHKQDHTDTSMSLKVSKDILAVKHLVSIQMQIFC